MPTTRRFHPAVTSALLLGWVACAHHPIPPPAEFVFAEAVAHQETILSTVVPDTARAAQMGGLLAREKKLFSEANEKRAVLHARLQALIADYDAPAVAFSQVLEEEDAVRDAAMRAAVPLRVQLAALATDAEWKQLVHGALASIKETEKRKTPPAP